MFQKLLDPGLKYDHIGHNADYDIVKVSFKSSGDNPTDIYQVHVNKKTNLIDRFLFTVKDFGVMETPLLIEGE